LKVENLIKESLDDSFQLHFLMQPNDSLMILSYNAVTVNSQLQNQPPMFGKKITTLYDGPFNFYIRKTPLLATDPDQPPWMKYWLSFVNGAISANKPQDSCSQQ